MPLYDGYGVLVGTVRRYSCSWSRQGSRYYHCDLSVTAGSGTYRCPVDLDSKQLPDGVLWRVVELERFSFTNVVGLKDGWHWLQPEPRSGALDYYRCKALKPTSRAVPADGERSPAEEVPVAGSSPPWRYGTGIAAYRDLEPLLKELRRIYVFGEPFRNGKGVHNIHQNQGDPPGSRWYDENGPWQDGGLVVERMKGSLAAFLCKFKTQDFF